MLKLFCSIIINVLHNYFDSPSKLFSHLYLAKFLLYFSKTSSVLSVQIKDTLKLHATLTN